MAVLAPWTLVVWCALAPLAASSPVSGVRLAAAPAALQGQGGAQNRLPLTALPDSYEVSLDVDLERGEFTGKVDITLQPAKTTKSLTFSVDLDILTIGTPTIAPSQHPQDLITITKENEDRSLQMVTVRTDDKTSLYPGTSYLLSIPYTGKLRSDMYGFYNSSYTSTTDGRQQRVPLAATQFEPTHARSAFPCWDEPHYKATFKLSITHAQGLHALSNTEVEGTPATVGTRTTTTFKKTPKMSSYLVAFVVSDFEATTAPTPTTTPTSIPSSTPTPASTPTPLSTAAPTADPTSVPYKVWVRPNQLNQAQFAATVGPKSLKAMETFTGIPYSEMGLNKLDLIAIPDFSAGAMENWGLITFRETGIMFTDGESTESSRESIALVIAHEQAHMWFGDLVSPDWWGYVWLNEGFARYFQYVSMDLVEPEWRLMDTFRVRTLQGALAFDALKSTHPMTATVFSPDAIQGIFDRISYDKGAAVLHMTRGVLGEDKFKIALKQYLANRNYDTAIPYDLFKAFDAALGADSGLPDGLTIALYLEAWTQEEGYPVVTLRTDNGKTTVSQERFFSSETSCSSANTRWWVPLTYTAEGGDFSHPESVWLDPRNATTTLDGQASGWILANIDQRGFYRVNYDDANWARLASLLQTPNNNVPIPNRAQMLDDALSLARAGLLEYPVALNVTRYLSTETEPIPWTAALGHLDFLRKMLVGDAAQTAFDNYVLGLMGAVYKNVSFAETEDAEVSKNHLRLTFRPTLLGEACGLGLKDCVDNARDAFAALRNGSRQVPASQRSTVYCVGVRYGTYADWTFMWARYSDLSTTVGERSLVLAALGCSNNASTINEYLGYSLDASKVRAQDASSVFSAVLSGGDANLDRAFDYFTNNFDRMNTAYGGWSAMQNVVNGLANRIVDETRLQKLEDFLTSKSSALGVAQAAAERSLETARANLAWRRQHLQTVSGWLVSGAPLGLHAVPFVIVLAAVFALLRG